MRNSIPWDRDILYEKIFLYNENGRNDEEKYFTSFKTASESVKEYMEKIPPLWQEYQIEKYESIYMMTAMLAMTIRIMGTGVHTYLQFEHDIFSPNIMEPILCSMSPVLQGNGYIEIMLDYSRKMLRLNIKETDSALEELEHHYEHFVHFEKYDEMLLKHFAALEPEVS